MSFLQDKIYKLEGKAKHYDWGGYEFITDWLGVENKEQQPYAEYWMGAHHLASSDIITSSGNLSLQQLIKDHSEEVIGKKVSTQFGELPYLFKIQDVKEMLSIQVHPSKEEAEKGFTAEEALGININAANRNYKDKNHKPEVLVALREFWLLHGFKESDALMKTLKDVPEFNQLVSLFKGKDYKRLYRHVMEMAQHEINLLLTPLVKRELSRKQNKELTKQNPGWWITKLYEQNEKASDIDRGVFSVYFFNIVEVNPGEAVFQGAGIPHAYLEGQVVELMANSDNVLRGGLTKKHIDIPELMKHISFEGIIPDVIKGKEYNKGEKNYPCPVNDFAISKLELEPGPTYNFKASSFEIIAVMEGEVNITGKNSLTFKKGEVAAILYGETYNILPSQPTLAYKAFVP